MWHQPLMQLQPPRMQLQRLPSNNNIYDRLPWLWCTNVLWLSNHHYHDSNHHDHPSCQDCHSGSQKGCQDGKDSEEGNKEGWLLPLSISVETQAMLGLGKQKSSSFLWRLGTKVVPKGETHEHCISIDT